MTDPTPISEALRLLPCVIRKPDGVPCLRADDDETGCDRCEDAVLATLRDALDPDKFVLVPRDAIVALQRPHYRGHPLLSGGSYSENEVIVSKEWYHEVYDLLRTYATPKPSKEESA